MRRFLQIILLKPILWASKKFASRPDRKRIFTALSRLYFNIQKKPGKKGIILPLGPQERFIIFSDQHRGAKNGADDFMKAEPSYLAALDYYFKNSFQFISLGDSEELWENSLMKVKKFNEITFEAEKKFIQQNRFYKIFGNHDLYWANDPLSGWQLEKIYGQEVKIYEGLILQQTKTDAQSITSDQQPETGNLALTIFLTHGHQGDASSDGNWFSKFFVANIWAPLQAFLRINPNTPAYDEELKTEHNRIMYEWSAKQKNLVLITGHTHQPVFESLTHIEKLYLQLRETLNEKQTDKISKLESAITKLGKGPKTFSPQNLVMKPSYFNSGCCCFSDGDITGIEITSDKISLIKWGNDKGREVKEEKLFKELYSRLN